jgi:hypothetical protein
MKILVLLTVGLLTLVTQPSQYTREPGNGQSPIACTLTAKSSFTQGEPILLRFKLDNKSAESRVVNLGYDREGAFQFKLVRPNGVSIKLPQMEIREGISLPDEVVIPAQESHSQQIILDNWYKFTEPGSYRLALEMPDSPCVRQELQFEITPEDLDRLKSVCKELMDAATNKIYASAADAAKALARVHNPIAVPFLTKALESNPMVSSIVIPALGGIGDKQAIRSLISILERYNGTTSEYAQARGELANLETKSAAEEVEMIRIALARFPIH